MTQSQVEPMPAARSEMKITGTEHRMLRALNTYRLLTYDTMRRVGVGRDQKTLSSATRHLQSRGLIGSREAVLIPGRKPRSLPTLFWLRPRGASALADFDPEAANALGVERDMRDTHEVLHRLGQFCVTGTTEIRVVLEFHVPINSQRSSCLVVLVRSLEHIAYHILDCERLRPTERNLR